MIRTPAVRNGGKLAAPSVPQPASMSDHTLPRSDPHEEADLREFEAFAATQDPVALEAATWATRRHGGLDAAGEGALRAWLAADPAHGAALEAMESSFARVRHLPPEAVQDWRQRAAAMAPPRAAASVSAATLPRRPLSPARRAWLSGTARFLPQAAVAAVTVAVTGGAWIGWRRWQAAPTFSEAYATARGERRDLALPDGSLLQLDTDTRIVVRLFHDRREVRLEEGQAMFSVRADASRPFEVLAGRARVTVVGTRFSVRHTRSGLEAGKTVVAVEEGRVRVARDDGADAGTLLPAALLTPGQALAVDGNGRFGPLARLAPAAIAPWRQGRVSFDDTPLAEALAEFERYGPTGLRVGDAQVAALRLGGSFDLREAGSFARLLPRLLPVRLQEHDGVTEIVRLR